MPIYVERGTEDAILAETFARLKLRPLIAKAQTPSVTVWNPLPHQVAPIEWLTGDKPDWLCRWGRGSGKTRRGAESVLEHLREHGGPHCFVGVGAPTRGDVRATCFEGDSGLMTVAAHEFPVWNKTTLEAKHYNGGTVRGIGAEVPARWNGPQHCFLWRDELALWEKESFDQSEFGLRLEWTDRTGRRRGPLSINTTTPKNRRFVKDFEAEPETVTTRASIDDNPYLAKSARDKLNRRYGGTRLGRQELAGEYVEDVEGALWQRAWIDDARVTLADVPRLVRAVVAVDPAVTKLATSDQTGIFVGGCTDRDASISEYFVLHLRGYRLSPNGWGTEAIDLYDEHEADLIVGEVNNGGDMVEATIRAAAESMQRSVPFKKITASRGKTIRAEPIAALYQQLRVHHVGVFAEAEDQMCSFPIENEYDDMVDADTMGLTELSEPISKWGGT